MHNYPEWLPQKAIDTYQELMNFQRESPDLWKTIHGDPDFHQFLTAEEMRPAWQTLERLYQSLNSPCRDPFMSFWVGLYDAFLGPFDVEELDTPKKRDERLEKIKLKAYELAALVQDTGVDNMFSFEQSTVAASADVSYEDIPWYLRETASYMLIELAKRADDWLEPAVLHRPNAPDAQRAYFVRRLTQQFQKNFSKPMRTVVLCATIVAFNDYDLTERQIIRIAP